MRVGHGCTFYHEGGQGERRWVVGWRYGIVRAIPARGARKNFVHIEIPVRLYAWEEDRGAYRAKTNGLAWVHRDLVNPMGDYTFHTEERDARNAELVAEVALRAETKMKEQAKVDKRVRRK